MTSADDGQDLALVYGAIGDPAAAARHTLADLRRSGLPLSTGAAIIGPGTSALRLNTRGWLDIRPHLASGLKTHEDRVAFCRAGIAKAVPLFTAGLATFLDDYARLIEQLIDDKRDLLEERLVAIGLAAGNPLFDYRDWYFSAFLPLPNAYVRLPDSSDAGAAPFARVDCAFWTGEVLLAVVFETHNLPRPSERRARERLERTPRVEMVRIPPAGLRIESVTGDRVRSALSGFLDSAPVPYGMFRIGGIGAPAGVVTPDV